jgi:methylmalonyl-CoA mutase cobalamin-binding subunit
VHHLGTQVPPDELIELAQQERAQLVVLPSCHDAAVGPTEKVGELVRKAGLSALVGHPGDHLRDLLAQAREVRAAR